MLWGRADKVRPNQPFYITWGVVVGLFVKIRQVILARNELGEVIAIEKQVRMSDLKRIQWPFVSWSFYLEIIGQFARPIWIWEW